MEVIVTMISGREFKLDDNCFINEVSVGQSHKVSRIIYNFTTTVSDNRMIHFTTPDGDYLIPVTSIEMISIKEN
ncbi:MAG: hypothetical protein RR565_08055 [Erysipelothrix sp.]